MLRLIIWAASIWFTLVFLAGCAQQKGNLPLDSTGQAKTDQEKNDDLPKAKTPEITATTYYTTGLILEQQGNYAGAIDKFNRAIDADHHCTSAYNHLGLCYMRLRNYDLAEDTFKQALQQSPNLPYLHNNLGFTYLLQNKFTNAEAELKNAITLDPNFRRAHANLAVALAKQGKPDQALPHFLQANSRPEAHYNLALVLHSQGNYDLAEKHYKIAVRLNPDFQPARTGLDQIRQDRNQKTVKITKAE
jgi:tetratricopeptide (TPR) repeat protein